MVTTITYPTAPTLTKRRGTLLDAATVTDSGTGWFSDYEWIFDSYNCMKFDSDAVWCGPNNKTFDNTPAWQGGFKFAAYGGVVCKAVGFDASEAETRAKEAFLAGESNGIERALMKTRFVDGPAEHWNEPVDLTPSGGAVSPELGVGLLESYAASNYAGEATLHVPRVVGSLLHGSDALVLEGDLLRTKLGSKVAAGGGYDLPNTGPDGSESADGEKWLYATGEVVIIRDDLVVQQGFNQSNNDVVILAERMYFAVVDCFTAAVKVKLS